MPSKCLKHGNTCKTGISIRIAAIAGKPTQLLVSVEIDGFLQKPLQLLPIANGVDEPKGSLLD